MDKCDVQKELFKLKFCCADCRHYDTCVEPCRPVELLLEKVGITSDPENMPEEFMEKVRDDPYYWPEPEKTKKEIIHDLYFIDGMRQRDIACHAGCSFQYVSKVISEYKRKRKTPATKKVDNRGDRRLE